MSRTRFATILPLPCLMFLLFQAALPWCACEARPIPHIPSTVPPAPAADSENALVVPLDLKPSDEELLTQARDQQQQKEYAAALQLLTDLLQFYPESKLADTALLQIAECYKHLGRFEDARKSIQLLREKYPESACKEPALLFEAEMLAMDKKYAEAAQLLGPLAESKEKAIRLRALYILALTHEESKATESIRPLLEKIIADADENPYCSFALLELGKLEEKNNPKKALEYFQEAAKQGSASSREKWDATLRAGYLLQNQNQWKEAAASYQAVLESEEAPPSLRPLACFGLMQAYLNLKEYASLIDLSEKKPADFPQALRGQADFLTAEAYRLSGQPARALELYEKIERNDPKEEIAAISAWNAALLLDAQKDPRALEKLQSFIRKFSQSPQITQARLMLADRWFERKEFKKAAEAYALLHQDELAQKFEPKTQIQTQMRWAESLWYVKEYEPSALVLTQLLSQFKGRPEMAPAAWLLAQNQNALGKKEACLEALNFIIENFPAFHRHQDALWQAALLSLDLKKYAAANSYLEELIARYPQAKQVAQASVLLASSLSEQKKFKQAQPWWQKARTMDPAQYAELATQNLIQLAVRTEDVDALIAEIKSYDQLKKNKPAAPPLSTQTIEWLAHKLGGASRFEESEHYYQRALQATQDATQRKRIFLALAQLQMDQKKWPRAVEQWKIYRLNYPEDANKNVVLESLAKSCIGMGDFDMATQCAEQILRQSIEGTWNAKGRMLLGEIAFAQQKYDEASKIYSAVALLIDDPVITPLAKSKALEAKSMMQNVKPSG